MDASSNADATIALIDSGRLRPWKHQFIRAIFTAVADPTVQERQILAATNCDADRKQPQPLDLLWSWIEERPLGEQGGLRMLVGLFHPDRPINGLEAEYLIDWARERGVDERHIVEAFTFQ
jgi:hypothetical protein